MTLGLICGPPTQTAAPASPEPAHISPRKESASSRFHVQDLPNSRYFKVFGGESILILGTEDRRTMSGAEFGFGKPDPRLALRGYPAQIVTELKFDYSRASGDYREPASDLALGAIWTAHYEWPWHSPRGLYADWGGGAESVNHVSHDLPLSLDGAITAGFGYYFPHASDRVLVGIRYFHISNGGRKYPNFGQNQIQAIVGLKF